MEIYIIFCVYF